MKFDLKQIKMGISVGKPSGIFKMKCKRRVIVDMEKREWPEIEVD